MTAPNTGASLKDVATFLRKPGETLRAFTDEWKGLTDQDKVELRTGIGDGTLTY